MKNRFQVEIINSVFNKLINSSVLSSYEETEEDFTIGTMQRSFGHITLRNAIFSDSSDNSNLSMFSIQLKHFNYENEIYCQITISKHVYHYYL